MIPKNVITRTDVEIAANSLIRSTVQNNATKFAVSLLWKGKEIKLAPKKLVSEAFRIATGESLSVKRFSGGVETNRVLEALGFNVERM